MVFYWWTRRRREKLRAQPFLCEWEQALQDNVSLFQNLSVDEQVRVRRYVPVFVAEKHWEGCGGFTITPEVQATIGAQVAILTLGYDDEFFDHVQTILVYPDTYVAKHQSADEHGIVFEGRSPREGEAWYRGPVVLSWADLLADARRESDGGNLVLHEFAHQIDMLNGHRADGIPPLRSAAQFRRWSAVFRSAYEQLVADSEGGYDTFFDPYGATDPAEFFAVATEAFFEQPRGLQYHHAELYDLFREFYRQDPAGRDGARFD